MRARNAFAALAAGSGGAMIVATTLHDATWIYLAAFGVCVGVFGWISFQRER